MVEGVDCNERIEVWPKGFQDLVASARKLLAAEQVTNQGKDLAADISPVDYTLANLEPDSALIFDIDRVGQAPCELSA